MFKIVKSKLRTRDIVAAVIGGLTVIAVASNSPGAVDIAIGVAINVGIVYGIAALIDWLKAKT